jgi:hypothetical protein
MTKKINLNTFFHYLIDFVRYYTTFGSLKRIIQGFPKEKRKDIIIPIIDYIDKFQ